jgi:hypothetical protein
VTSIPFVRRTRATFRSAEFGFFGVCVNTRVQTPRLCGAPARAGVFVFDFGAVRPFLTSWLMVGMRSYVSFHTTTVGGHDASPTAAGMVAKLVMPVNRAKPHGHRIFGPTPNVIRA